MEGGMIGLNMLVSPIYIWRCLSTVSPRPREEGRSWTDQLQRRFMHRVIHRPFHPQSPRQCCGVRLTELNVEVVVVVTFGLSISRCPGWRCTKLHRYLMDLTAHNQQLRGQIWGNVEQGCESLVLATWQDSAVSPMS